jgi:hypothetical protein
MECVHKWFIYLQTRFTSREHHHLSAFVGDVIQVLYFGYDLFGGHRRKVRELRVAPRATQVTTAEPNKNSGDTHVRTLAL